MTQEITQSGASVGDEAVVLEVTRSPLRIDGKRLTNTAGSPRLGEHNEAVRTEMERHGAKNGKESKP
jgi:crotonobetainyl-CoA:carnitine CoA-transferase CaiB-like acyl-CoA transferase